MSSFLQRSKIGQLYRTYRELHNKSKTLRWTVSILYWLPAEACRFEFCDPYYHDSSQWKDLVLFDRLSTKTFHQYNRGDVVAIHSPTHQGMLLVKRILALPGDTVKTLPPYPDVEVHIPPGHVWIEGDDPSHSEDSNWFGPVPQGLIDSKLSWILFPFHRWGPLDSVHNRGLQRGHAWSQQADQLEREKRRKSRVASVS